MPVPARPVPARPAAARPVAAACLARLVAVTPWEAAAANQAPGRPVATVRACPVAAVCPVAAACPGAAGLAVDPAVAAYPDRPAAAVRPSFPLCPRCQDEQARLPGPAGAARCRDRPRPMGEPRQFPPCRAPYLA